MAKTGKLKCALVGCGVAARRSHLPVLKDMKNVEVSALCDESLPAARDMALAFQVPNTYKDFSLMLDKEKPDFVIICSPPATHFKFGMEAMKRKVHVLSEKPLASNTVEADAMIQEAKEKGIKFSVVHGFLYTPVIMKASAMAAAGELGQVLSVDVDIMEKRDGVISDREHWSNRLRGGRAADLGVHAVYLILKFLGKIKNVKAAAGKYTGYPWVKQDELKVLLEAERGLGSFCISFNAHSYSHGMVIRGTKKTLILDDFFMTMVTTGPFKSGRLCDHMAKNLSMASQLVRTSISGFLNGKLGHKWYRDGHRHIIMDFVRSIVNDTGGYSEVEDSRECLRILEEVWEQIGDRDENSL